MPERIQLSRAKGWRTTAKRWTLFVAVMFVACCASAAIRLWAGETWAPEGERSAAGIIIALLIGHICSLYERRR